MVTVTFHEGGAKRSISVARNTSLLEAARLAGVLVEAPCGGHGTCGKCKVRIRDQQARNAVDAGANSQLPLSELAQGYVLACRSVVLGDVDVEVIERADRRSVQTVSDGQQRSFDLNGYIAKRYLPSRDQTMVLAGDSPIGTEPGDTSADNYGVVVDIGTTTLVVALFDIATGRELASTAALNPQGHYAQDVLSRIKFASTDDGLRVMHSAIVDALNCMIRELADQTGIATTRIYEVVFSGNATMLHLAARVDPTSLGKYPYTPALWGGRHLAAAKCGLALGPLAQIYLPPFMSAYVGADITSGILAARLHELPGRTLFVDIGTNGEMVLANNGDLVAASTAAGPALEGMNISCGMRAAPGAIERFTIDDGEIAYQTIGGSEAEGICGSGLIDIVGELVRYGIIQANGRLARSGRSPAIDGRLVQHEGKPAFRITDRVYLSQKDVRQVQLAKGAIRAGLEALLVRNGLSSADVDRTLIAGAFGYHLNPESLVNLGLLPPGFHDRIQFLGNTSKTGGQAFLLNWALREEMREVAARVTVVDLATTERFDHLFVSSLGF